ncbi:unnamed protein product [Discosporangium mesarthrocarpum]
MEAVLSQLCNQAGTAHLMAPYMHTPEEVIPDLVKFLDVHPGDTLVDIGCGDARVIIEAARLTDASFVGYDIDEEAIANARERLGKQDDFVQSRVRIRHADALTAREDWGKVTQVYIYLTKAGVTKKAWPFLCSKLAPGTPVVVTQHSLKGEVLKDVHQTSYVDLRGDTIHFKFSRFLTPGLAGTCSCPP